MPIHDWTRVIAGVFHHFHGEWISAICRALNAGRLPPGYYALAEPIAGGLGPDVLALEMGREEKPSTSGNGSRSSVATLTIAPPRARFTRSVEIEALARRRNRVAIRHSSEHKVIAVIEIVSPGNKANKAGMRDFVNKALELLDAGVHLTVIDLFPPGKRDPQGIHAALWSEIEDDDFQLPADKPLTLAAYAAGMVKRAFIEPVAVGDALPDVAVFLDPESYVSVPLEATYQAAWEGVPPYWREQLL